MNVDTTKMIRLIENFFLQFIRKDKQDRLIGFLQKEKNWQKINWEFHTSSNFKQEKLIEIIPNEHFSEEIYSHLIKLGAKKECYSILDYLDNDEYKCDLQKKVEETFGSLIHTIIYCPISGIGYFEGGHAKDRFILKRD